MQNNVDIEADLENSPLEIKTDSSLGSNEIVSVGFYTSAELWVGRLTIHFTSTPRYQIWHCTSKTKFPTDLPTDTIKVWKIALTRTSGIRLVIDCNNKEVLNILLSDTTCSNSYWNGRWSKDVGMIKFYQDTASDYYRGKLRNKGSGGYSILQLRN